MNVSEVSLMEYGSALKQYIAVYNSPEFNHLNRGKADDIKCLLFTDKKICAGLIAGLKNGILASPFSAPFGGFSYANKRVKLGDIAQVVEALEIYAKKQNISGIRMTLPPQFYEDRIISKHINIFYINAFNVVNIDLNFQFDLAELDSNYKARLWRNAKKNLRIALDNNTMTFRVCLTDGEKKAAYTVIEKNRQAKKYPLRMSFNQVMDTCEILNSDFFLLESKHLPVAAAIVFHASPEIAQVIYWGDIPGNSSLKPMNLLAHRIFEFYKEKDFSIVDIGPSSQNSLPNHGLCEFKESIGCSISPKFTFEKMFD